MKLKSLLVLALAVGLAVVGTSCASGTDSHSPLSHTAYGWPTVVAAGGRLSEKREPSTLTFGVSGTKLRVIGEFSSWHSNRNPALSCSLRAANKEDGPVGEPIPLKYTLQPWDSSFYTVFQYQTTSPLKPGWYQLTYWGEGYCDYLIVSAK